MAVVILKMKHNWASNTQNVYSIRVRAFTTSGAEGDTDGVGEPLDASLESRPGFLVKCDVLGFSTHHESLRPAIPGPPLPALLAAKKCYITYWRGWRAQNSGNHNWTNDRPQIRRGKPQFRCPWPSEENRSWGPKKQFTATPGNQESCPRGRRGGADLREGPDEGGGGDGVGGGHRETAAEELGASREDKVEDLEASGEARRGLEMR